MRNATMFIVGMMMIAMLVGFGASAGAPADIEDGYVTATKEKGQFLEVDEDDDAEDVDCPEHVHPLWKTAWLVVGSTGGAYICDGDCPPDEEPDRAIRF